MKTKSSSFIAGLVLTMNLSVASAQFLVGSTANAWGEPTDSQGRVIGKPVVCNVVGQPIPIKTQVVSVGQVQQPVQMVVQPKRSILARIFSMPAEPEAKTTTQVYHSGSGPNQQYSRVTETVTVDKSRFPDYTAPLALQSKLPVVENRAFSTQCDFGVGARGLTKTTSVEARKQSDQYFDRYIAADGSMVTRAVTVENTSTFEGSFYSYDQPQIIQVPTANAGTVYGNPPGILVMKALITPPPKKVKR